MLSSSSEAHLRATEHHPPWDHTALPATPTQENTPRLSPSQIGQYSIYLPRRDGRLSWPRQLVTYWDGLPVRRESPVQVLTRPGNVDRMKRVIAMPCQKQC